MEVKAQLEKPYTEEQRMDFIVKQNHKNGYEIRETENSLGAWGYTEEEKEDQRKEQIAKLSMTKREMFLGLYQAKQITHDMLKAQITDPRALIEFEYANDYFRGNPLIDVIGGQLGFTSEQLDDFFETRDYHYLTNITLKINATPSEAVVTINGKETKEFSTPYQPNLQLPVTYSVVCEGYTTKEDEIVLTENTVLDVVLDGVTE